MLQYRRSAPAMAHTLSLLQSPPYLTGYFVCHLCWERGSGPLYHCSDCQFDIHTFCAGTGNQQTHFSHFQHTLHLKSVRPGHVCDGCQEQIQSWVYRCSVCDYDMCALCVRAPRFVLHVAHPHVLTMSRVSELTAPTCHCDACEKPASGMVYRCTSCNFDLHQSCVRLPLKPMHPKHPQHPLTLLCHPENAWNSYTCNHCGREGRGWVYSCSHCSFNLHLNCARIQHEIPRGANMQALRRERVEMPRANLQGLWPEPDEISYAEHEQSMLSPSSTLFGRPYSSNPTLSSSSALVPSTFDRPYSSSMQPISPYPYTTLQNSTSLDRSRNYWSRGGSPNIDRTSTYLQDLSQDRYAFSQGDHWSNRNDVPADTIVQALRGITPSLNARDAAAVERVVGLLRQDGSSYYD